MPQDSNDRAYHLDTDNATLYGSGIGAIDDEENLPEASPLCTDCELDIDFTDIQDFNFEIEQLENFSDALEQHNIVIDEFDFTEVFTIDGHDCEVDDNSNCTIEALEIIETIDGEVITSDPEDFCKDLSEHLDTDTANALETCVAKVNIGNTEIKSEQ